MGPSLICHFVYATPSTTTLSTELQFWERHLPDCIYSELRSRVNGAHGLHDDKIRQLSARQPCNDHGTVDTEYAQTFLAVKKLLLLAWSGRVI